MVNKTILAFDNIRAKAMSLGLWRYVRTVYAISPDRVYVRTTASMLPKLKEHKKFQKSFASKGHRERIFTVFGVKPEPLFSYRELASPSLQVTVTESGYGDMDIDLGNPTSDFKGLFVHLFEVLVPGMTSHRKIRKKLERDKNVSRYLTPIEKLMQV